MRSKDLPFNSPPPARGGQAPLSGAGMRSETSPLIPLLKRRGEGEVKSVAET